MSVCRLLQGGAREQYCDFVARYPHLARRVPQYHIASYLGITEVHLSRLRKTLEHELAAWRLRQEGPGAIEAVRHLGNDPPVAVYQGRGHPTSSSAISMRRSRTIRGRWKVARAAVDRRAELQSLLALGFLWSGRDFAQTGGNFRRALEVAQEMHDQAAIGHSLNRLGNWHMMIEQPLEARHLHEQARRTFDQLDDPHGLAETLDLLGTTTL
jgi:hypothetical protein